MDTSKTEETRIRFLRQLAQLSVWEVHKLLKIETVEECATLGWLADQLNLDHLDRQIWEHLKDRCRS